MTTNHTPSKASIILLIDDNLRAAPPDAGIEFVIEGPDAVGAIPEYLTLLDSLSASAVLIDHHLGESSSAPYTGLELATSLRAVRSMLPIFILTKYAEDDRLEENGFVVDDVMDRAILYRHAGS
jgi:CheY-like chemotaxis protein